MMYTEKSFWISKEMRTFIFHAKNLDKTDALNINVSWRSSLRRLPEAISIHVQDWVERYKDENEVNFCITQ